MKTYFLRRRLCVVLGVTCCLGLTGTLQSQEIKIHEAAARGDVATIKKLLDEDRRWVNSRGRFHFTPLHSAIEKHRLKAAKLLIERGADIEAEIFSKGSPLQFAAELRHREMLRLLLESGADPNGIGDREEDTPISLAHRDLDSLKLLLKHGANIDGVNESGATALILAAQRGDFPIVQSC